MIVKVLLLPFWVLQKTFGLIFTCIKLITALGSGIFRFTLGRVVGTIIGALAGALLGGKHVGIKIFPKKR
jgi:hypothetical protein